MLIKFLGQSPHSLTPSPATPLPTLKSCSAFLDNKILQGTTGYNCTWQSEAKSNHIWNIMQIPCEQCRKKNLYLIANSQHGSMGIMVSATLSLAAASHWINLHAQLHCIRRKYSPSQLNHQGKLNVCCKYNEMRAHIFTSKQPKIYEF